MQFLPRIAGHQGHGRSRRTIGSIVPWKPNSYLPAGLILLLGALAPSPSAIAADADEGAAANTPPPSVVVAAVANQAVGRQGRFIGNIQAIQSVELKARVEGFLEQIAFEEGAMVDAGQLLYQIEQDQYKAALASAEGEVAAAKADAASAAAALENKQGDYDRQAALIKKGDTSQTMFDQAKAQRDEAKANVEKAAASEQQAAAAVQTAKINLGYTTIKSPIKGRIGATSYTRGNLVGPDSGTLATVVQLDPIRAVFSIPSRDFVRMMSRIRDTSIQTYKAKFLPELILPTGERYDRTGKIAFANNQVDASTGTVAIYADFPNPDHLLLPGQFVTAVVSTTETESMPVVPAAALQRTRDGEQVYVVGPDNRVELRNIKTAARTDTGYAVESGLTEGELVIVSGIQKVKPGVLVAPSRQHGDESKSRDPSGGKPADAGKGGKSEAGAGDAGTDAGE